MADFDHLEIFQDERNTRMRKPALILFLGTILSGCAALPVPVQIASWALDGLSVITTQKSLTDHGLSMVSNQDCAIWRGFTEGEICRDSSIEVEVLTAAVTTPDPLAQPVVQVASPKIASKSPPVLVGMYLDVI